MCSVCSACMCVCVCVMVETSWFWWVSFFNNMSTPQVKPMLAVWRADEEIKEKDVCYVPLMSSQDVCYVMLCHPRMYVIPRWCVYICICDMYIV